MFLLYRYLFMFPIEWKYIISLYCRVHIHLSGSEAGMCREQYSSSVFRQTKRKAQFGEKTENFKAKKTKCLHFAKNIQISNINISSVNT